MTTFESQPALAIRQYEDRRISLIPMFPSLYEPEPDPVPDFDDDQDDSHRSYHRTLSHATLESANSTAKNSSSAPDAESSSHTSYSTRAPSPPPRPEQPSQTWAFDHDEIDNVALKLLESSSMHRDVGSIDLSQFSAGSDIKGEQGTYLFLPTVFKSLAICDPRIQGYPIKLKSKYFSMGPRSLKVGKCQFLNIPDGEGNGFFLSSRPGSDGRPQFVLEYAGTLIGAESGSATYIVSSQMDMTLNMRNLATNLLADSKDYGPTSKYFKLLTALYANASTNPKSYLGRMKQHESSFPPKTPYKKLSSRDSVDWLELAHEQSLMEDGLGLDRHQEDEIALPDADMTSLAGLIKDLTFIHRERIVLSASPSTGFWQISWLSPSLFADQENAKVGLSNTPSDALITLGIELSNKRPVSLLVKWGTSAEEKRMYCVPMYHDDFACWLCFLLPASVPNLWDVER